jgi:hypothetical protein
MPSYFTENEFFLVGPSIGTKDVPHHSVRIRKDADINSYKERIDECMEGKSYKLEEREDDGTSNKHYWIKLI